MFRGNLKLLTRGRRFWIGGVLAVLLLLGAIVIPSLAADADWKTWQPSDSQWVNGLPQGYMEHETAPFYVNITGAQNWFGICLDYQTAGSYGFTGLAPWNTTYNVSLPTGDPLTDTSNANVWGRGVTITSVTGPSLNDTVAGCGASGGTDRIFWRVDFTRDAGATDFWVVFGAHIAAPGDPLPFSPPPTVPGDKGAASINGTFAASLTNLNTGVLPFKGSDITPLPGLNLVKTVTTVSGSCPGYNELDVPQGATVKYCFAINNNGTAPLLNVTLNDPLLGGDLTALLVGLTDLDNDGQADDLAAGGTATASKPYVVTADLLNTAYATGSDLNYEDPSSVWVYVVDVAVTKQVSTNGTNWFDTLPVKAGDPIWWQVVFTNNSTRNKTINLTSSDLLDGAPLALTCAEGAIPATLAAGASFTCTMGPGVAVIGTHTNAVTAGGCYTDPVFSPPDLCDTANDSASYTASATIKVCKNDTEGGPIAGWGVTLRSDARITDAAGCYTWTVAEAGTYTATEEARSGWTPQGDTSHDFVVAGAVPAYGPYTFVNFQNQTITACKQNTEGGTIAGWGMTLTGPDPKSGNTGANGCVVWPVTKPGALHADRGSCGRLDAHRTEQR